MSGKIILPGLIDSHVHLRDPGLTQKEDFYTGTSAALAGGYTIILDMPNNKELVDNQEKLFEKIKIAKKKIVCDVGFYFGSLGNNIEEFKNVKSEIFGLKVFLNATTGKNVVNKEKAKLIYQNWPGNRPILVHAEGKMVEFVIELVKKTGKRTHFCHVSSKEELKPIIKAKEDSLPITCGVTPHHLFLTDEDIKKLGPFGKMRPSLKRKQDIDYFWQNLKFIEVIESDHAPHTVEEKLSDNPPMGVPGLETTLPLLLTATHEKRLTLQDIIEKCYDNPKRIFNIPNQPDSFIEVDNSSFEIRNSSLQTKCGWSPFDGFQVRGKVRRVFIQGTKVFEDDKVIVRPGFGKIIRPL